MQKQYRLKKNASFNYIYRRGKSIANKHMVIVYVRTYQPTKVGFSVSKKVGKSVTRNLIKRRLRGAFGSILTNVDGRYNYVVIARASITELTYLEIYSSITRLLKKEGLYNEA